MLKWIISAQLISSYHVPEMNYTEAIRALAGNLGTYLGKGLLLKQDDWDDIV